jgi:hypothetical protein
VHPSQERLCSRPCSTRLYEHSESPHSIPHPDPIPIFTRYTSNIGTCYNLHQNITRYWLFAHSSCPSVATPPRRTPYTLCMLGYPPRHVPLRPYAAIGVYRVVTCYSCLHTPPPRPGERRPPSHETHSLTHSLTHTLSRVCAYGWVFRLHRLCGLRRVEPTTSPRTAEPRVDATNRSVMMPPSITA